MNIPVEQSLEGKAIESAAPRHVAIIMDGNGRWAKRNGKLRIEGHRQGVKAVHRAITGAVNCGVDFLTLYAFSTENWNRSDTEVSDLMDLLRYYLKSEIKTLHSENIRLRVIGDSTPLKADIVSMVKDAEELTKSNNRMTLVIALNYGGRDEIISAIQSVAEKHASGNLALDDITESYMSDQLYTKSIPDPDLIIRTSGEQRLSNFLLWQLAYSELMFMDVLWPDFTEDHMELAVKDYMERDRRFGGRATD